MPAWSLQPLTYTTPPFAAVSGIVEHDTVSTPAIEPGKPDLSKPVLKGPWWTIVAVIVVVAASTGLSIAWWKTYKARLARGHYNELVPVREYPKWRERRAIKLLSMRKTGTRADASASANPSGRDSSRQQSDSVAHGHPPSKSPSSKSSSSKSPSSKSPAQSNEG